MPMSGDSPRYIKSGITENTPGNFTFGAGVLLKNLQWSANRKVRTEDTTPQSGKTYYYWYQNQWQTFSGDEFDIYEYYEVAPGFDYKSATKIGATKDGTTLKIAPEYTDIDIDGVLVKMKQMTVKTGEVATLETTFTENTAENAALAINGDIATQSDIVYGTMGTLPTGTQIVKSRSAISVNDYITNLAFIANRIDDGSNRETVVIFKNALCTSGFEIATKNKDVSTFKMTFECCADLASDVPVKLPFEIIYLGADNA